jgi:CheY-like chemotaxis protein
VPVIYITGNTNPKVREAALASGCIAFLAKPFPAHELIEPLRGYQQEIPNRERFNSVSRRLVGGALPSPLERLRPSRLSNCGLGSLHSAR